MQQLIITILALLSVILPIIAVKLRRLVITPRLLKLFQHMFLTKSHTKGSVFVPGIGQTDVHQFAGSPDWENLLAYARSGRSFCIAFACRLFPKAAFA